MTVVPTQVWQCNRCATETSPLAHAPMSWIKISVDLCFVSRFDAPYMPKDGDLCPDCTSGFLTWWSLARQSAIAAREAGAGE